MAESSSNRWKSLSEKEKLLVSSNFSFSHSVFKSLVLQTHLVFVWDSIKSICKRLFCCFIAITDFYYNSHTTCNSFDNEMLVCVVLCYVMSFVMLLKRILRRRPINCESNGTCLLKGMIYDVRNGRTLDNQHFLIPL